MLRTKDVSLNVRNIRNFVSPFSSSLRAFSVKSNNRRRENSRQHRRNELKLGGSAVFPLLDEKAGNSLSESVLITTIFEAVEVVSMLQSMEQQWPDASPTEKDRIMHGIRLNSIHFTQDERLTILSSLGRLGFHVNHSHQHTDIVYDIITAALNQNLNETFGEKRHQNLVSILSLLDNAVQKVQGNLSATSYISHKVKDAISNNLEMKFTFQSAGDFVNCLEM